MVCYWRTSLEAAERTNNEDIIQREPYGPKLPNALSFTNILTAPPPFVKFVFRFLNNFDVFFMTSLRRRFILSVKLQFILIHLCFYYDDRIPCRRI